MKQLTIGTIVLALLTLFVANVTAQRERLALCHIDEDGVYHRVEVAEPAYDNHIAHGDAAIGDPVPNMDGFTFDENCQPEATFPSIDCVGFPVFSSTLYVDFGGTYFLSLDEVIVYEDSHCTVVFDTGSGVGHGVYAPAPYDPLALCQTLDPTYTSVEGDGVTDLYLCLN